jgi:hypothetical protein
MVTMARVEGKGWHLAMTAMLTCPQTLIQPFAKSVLTRQVRSSSAMRSCTAQGVSLPRTPGSYAVGFPSAAFSKAASRPVLLEPTENLAVQSTIHLRPPILAQRLDQILGGRSFGIKPADQRIRD